jgi:RNA polymerase sigma-70 factor (sigma-E family)
MVARLRGVEPLIETGVPAGTDGADDPAAQVTALYEAHALGLLRLAVIMLGDQQAAEDVVQDAFLGLYRRWATLRGPDRALAYARSSVFNGCRTVLRKRARHRRFALAEPDAESAEARVLTGEEHRTVLEALRRLPDRQREAVALRYCLEMSPEDVARTMGVTLGTVKSATSRGITALGRMLEEES